MNGQSFVMQSQQRDPNEQLILAALQIFVKLTPDLMNFQGQLYANADQLSRSVFKQFRKIRESIDLLHTSLSSFTSQNPNFLQHKDVILQDHISTMQSQISRDESRRFNELDIRKRIKTSAKQPQKNNNPDFQFDLLRKQIQSLKNQLRRNDSQYQIQIKKYNFKFEEMQQQMDYYRAQLEKVSDYIEMAERLEVEIRILKEVKERDEQLIQNMAKKLRNIQRQRVGHTGFLSPKTMHSPSRIRSQYSPKSHILSRFE